MFFMIFYGLQFEDQHQYFRKSIMTNNSPLSLAGLKKKALRLYNGMVVIYPQYDEVEEELNLQGILPKFNGCYSVNNSTAIFVTKEGDAYSIPCTRKVRKTLEKNFEEKYFFVPFSNWSYPKKEQDKWFSLVERARRERHEEFLEDCNRFCEERGIKPLDHEIILNSLRIPETGIWVKHPYFKTCYYPVINNDCLDCLASEKIGKYCINNGIVVFIYRDGATYVTRYSRWLENQLIFEGYKKMDLLVPFSNGEEIENPVIKAKWISIKAKAI